MIETLGWIGCVLLALCGIPQAIKSIKDKHSRGISWSFILMWTLGEVLVLGYTIALGNWPLIVNYVANVLSCGVILFYKIKE